MADWRNSFGKPSHQEDPEDFILLRKDLEAAEVDTATNAANPLSPEDIRRSMDDTGELPVIPDKIFDSEGEDPEYRGYDLDIDGVTPLVREEKREPGFKGFVGTHKKGIIGIGAAVLTVGLLIGLFFLFSALSDPMRGYAENEVIKGNVIRTMSAEGTLTVNARYSITSLVSGKITASKPEVGDQVSAGEVLYELDDTEASLALERAKNQLSKSRAAGSTTTTGSDKIYSTASGTVNTVNIRSGGVVSYGQVVCTIKKEDASVIAVTSPVSGTVSSVNVGEGGTVSVNSLIASVTSAQATSGRQTAVYDQKSNELDVKMAEKHLENYTIKSPISGIVIAKNAKVGDNVSITNTENPMMVILDNSSLKFTFRVDEYAINDLQTGLDVIVSTESMPDEVFAGVISRVGNEGIANEDGKVMFEVDVTIDEPGDLKSGMKVSAKVILESATNVLHVPHQALMEADGKNAVVLIQDTGMGTSLSVKGSGEAPEYPWITVPKGCKLISVRYGVGDGTNVEIISGLKAGDIVVYDPDAELVNLKPESAKEDDSEDAFPFAPEDDPFTPFDDSKEELEEEPDDRDSL